MADIKFDINLADLNQENPSIPDMDDSYPKRNKTAGELIFDRTVYTGIGFGVNEVSSLWITDQFMHGKNLLAKIPGLKTIGSWFSQEGFGWTSEKIAKIFKLKEKIAYDGSKITPKARGGNALLMVTLLSGGTLLILPMKWLEDSKNYWVKKANHWVDWLRGNKLTEEQVESRDTEVERHIACSPRQSWPAMLLGRLVACVSSVTTGILVGPQNNDRLQDWSENLLTGSVQPKGKKTWLHRQAGLLSVETYSCAISSIVLEIMSKLFAKRSAHPHDPELCEKFSKTVAPVATSTNEESKPANDGNARLHAARIQSQKALAANEPATLRLP